MLECFAVGAKACINHRRRWPCKPNVLHHFAARGSLKIKNIERFGRIGDDVDDS